MTISEYRKYKAYNYSTLKNFDGNPRTYLQDNTDSKESIAMDKGSALDMYITDRKQFDKTIIKGPSEYARNTTAKLMKYLLELPPITSKKHLLSTALNIVSKNNLWERTKDPVKLESYFWNEDFVIEYKLKTQYKDKVILSSTDYDEVIELGNSLCENVFTKDYILPTKDIEVKYQHPIIFEYEGRVYKSLLDIIVINHWEKTIQPVDLKTSDDSAFTFSKKVFDPMFRYDIQAALYSEGCKNFRDDNYHDYEIKDFKFIVGSFKNPKLPLVYNAKDVIPIGTNGGVSNSGYRINGFRNIVDNLEWHIKNDLWEYTREVYENKEIILNNPFSVNVED